MNLLLKFFCFSKLCWTALEEHAIICAYIRAYIYSILFLIDAYVLTKGLI